MNIDQSEIKPFNGVEVTPNRVEVGKFDPKTGKLVLNDFHVVDGRVFFDNSAALDAKAAVSETVTGK